MKNEKRPPVRAISVLVPFFILFLCSGAEAFAQRIKYLYDNAGNRITRQEIVVSTTRAAMDNEEETVYQEELSESKITIYPNPTRGVLRVDISGVEAFENAGISLYDLTGKQLRQWREVSGSNTIDISDRNPGVYILQIAYNGNVSSWKIIKE
ncbi:T9SS type A sorting domain-containing protein [Bacteroides sp. UBA939]|uniref:T9SS type A sorting domain-containing protein n=1 Tax=Bacteroides sp. UBA939 TaxID=1946092 RepID=UPI0025C3B394|nr:T9SS type A sorting domain-containing protein [Bacteroides sp. UBA939]